MVLNTISLNHEYRNQCSRNAVAAHRAEKTPILSEIDRLDRATSQGMLYALSPLPPARRISSLPDSIEKGDYTRAGLLLGIATASLPSDVREIGLAFEEGKNIFKNGLSAVKYEGQHQTKFFRNTILGSLTEKIPWLKKIDKTLYNTKFGEFIRKTFDVKFKENRPRVGESSITTNNNELKKFKFQGNYTQRLTGRALMRVPVLGLVATAVLEVPALIESVKKERTILDKAKSFTNQLCKSAGYVGLVNSGIALAGAALIPYGYLAALIGMGVGGSLGLFASKELNKQVDKVIS